MQSNNGSKNDSLYCCISVCRNYKDPTAKVDLYPLPKDLYERGLWCKVLNIPESVAESPSSRVCGLHFRYKYFLNQGGPPAASQQPLPLTFFINNQDGPKFITGSVNNNIIQPTLVQNAIELGSVLPQGTLSNPSGSKGNPVVHTFVYTPPGQPSISANNADVSKKEVSTNLLAKGESELFLDCQEETLSAAQLSANDTDWDAFTKEVENVTVSSSSQGQESLMSNKTITVINPEHLNTVKKTGLSKPITFPTGVPLTLPVNSMIKVSSFPNTPATPNTYALKIPEIDKGSLISQNVAQVTSNSGTRFIKILPPAVQNTVAAAPNITGTPQVLQLRAPTSTGSFQILNASSGMPQLIQIGNQTLQLVAANVAPKQPIVSVSEPIKITSSTGLFSISNNQPVTFTVAGNTFLPQGDKSADLVDSNLPPQPSFLPSNVLAETAFPVKLERVDESAKMSEEILPLLPKDKVGGTESVLSDSTQLTEPASITKCLGDEEGEEIVVDVDLSNVATVYDEQPTPISTPSEQSPVIIQFNTDSTNSTGLPTDFRPAAKYDSVVELVSSKSPAVTLDQVRPAVSSNSKKSNPFSKFIDDYRDKENHLQINCFYSIVADPETSKINEQINSPLICDSMNFSLMKHNDLTDSAGNHISSTFQAIAETLKNASSDYDNCSVDESEQAASDSDLISTSSHPSENTDFDLNQTPESNDQIKSSNVIYGSKDSSLKKHIDLADSIKSYGRPIILNIDGTSKNAAFCHDNSSSVDENKQVFSTSDLISSHPSVTTDFDPKRTQATNVQMSSSSLACNSMKHKGTADSDNSQILPTFQVIDETSNSIKSYGRPIILNIDGTSKNAAFCHDNSSSVDENKQVFSTSDLISSHPSVTTDFDPKRTQASNVQMSSSSLACNSMKHKGTADSDNSQILPTFQVIDETSNNADNCSSYVTKNEQTVPNSALILSSHSSATTDFEYSLALESNNQSSNLVCNTADSILIEHDYMADSVKSYILPTLLGISDTSKHVASADNSSPVEENKQAAPVPALILTSPFMATGFDPSQISQGLETFFISQPEKVFNCLNSVSQSPSGVTSSSLGNVEASQSMISQKSLNVDLFSKSVKKSEKKDSFGIKKYICEICNKEFFSPYNVRRHCKNVHQMSSMNVDDPTDSVENQSCQDLPVIQENLQAPSCNNSSSNDESEPEALTPCAISTITPVAFMDNSSVETNAGCQRTVSALIPRIPDDAVNNKTSKNMSTQKFSDIISSCNSNEDAIKEKGKDKLGGKKTYKYSCKLCNEDFYSAYNVRRHCRRVHLCEMVISEDSNKNVLKERRDDKLGIEKMHKFWCKLCNKGCYSFVSMKWHIKYMHMRGMDLSKIISDLSSELGVHESKITKSLVFDRIAHKYSSSKNPNADVHSLQINKLAVHQTSATQFKSCIKETEHDAPDVQLLIASDQLIKLSAAHQTTFSSEILVHQQDKSAEPVKAGIFNQANAISILKKDFHAQKIQSEVHFNREKMFIESKVTTPTTFEHPSPTTVKLPLSSGPFLPVIVDVMSAKEGGQAIYTCNDTAGNSKKSDEKAKEIPEVTVIDEPDKKEKSQTVVQGGLAVVDFPSFQHEENKFKNTYSRNIIQNVKVANNAPAALQSFPKVMHTHSIFSLQKSIPVIPAGHEIFPDTHNLFSIKTQCNKNKASYVEALKSRLRIEEYVVNSVWWLLQNHYLPLNPPCNACGSNDFFLERNDKFYDKYCWTCKNENCRAQEPIQRPKFFEQFKFYTLEDLLILTFHWACQSDIDDVLDDVDLDVEKIWNYYKALQDLCLYVVTKNGQLGLCPNGRIEVSVVKLGSFFVLGALERFNRHTRLQVIPVNEAFETAKHLEVLEQWVSCNSTVISESKIPDKFLPNVYKVQADPNFTDLKSNGYHILNISRYLVRNMISIFGKVKIQYLHQNLIQGFLNELQWRDRYGKFLDQAFWSIFKDIGSYNDPKKASTIIHRGETLSYACTHLNVKQLEGWGKPIIKTTMKENDDVVFTVMETIPPKSLVAEREVEKKVADKPPEKSQESNASKISRVLRDSGFLNILFQDLPEIPGGEVVVTPKILLGIKIVLDGSPEALEKYKAESISLGLRLSAEGFINSPVRWLVKKGFIRSKAPCYVCHNTSFLRDNPKYEDGCSWLCQYPSCKFENIFKRPHFYARFPMLAMAHMNAMIYHWTVHSEISRIISDAPMEISKLQHVWRSFQVLCSTSLRRKKVRLGGEGEMVEVAMVQFGKLYILGAMERKTKHTLLRTFFVDLAGQIPVFLKVLAQWILPFSFIIINATKYVQMPPEYNIMFADSSITDPDDPGSHVLNITSYLLQHVSSMFGYLKAEDVRSEVLQIYLDELMWRQRYGTMPNEAFYNILGDIFDLETKDKHEETLKNHISNFQKENVCMYDKLAACAERNDPSHESKAIENYKLVEEKIDPASLPQCRVVLKRLSEEVLKYYNCLNYIHSKQSSLLPTQEPPGRYSYVKYYERNRQDPSRKVFYKMCKTKVSCKNSRTYGKWQSVFENAEPESSETHTNQTNYSADYSKNCNKRRRLLSDEDSSDVDGDLIDCVSLQSNDSRLSMSSKSSVCDTSEISFSTKLQKPDQYKPDIVIKTEKKDSEETEIQKAKPEAVKPKTVMQKTVKSKSELQKTVPQRTLTQKSMPQRTATQKSVAPKAVAIKTEIEPTESAEEELICVECGKSISMDHFMKQFLCMDCKKSVYTTSCCNSFMEHRGYLLFGKRMPRRNNFDKEKYGLHKVITLQDTYQCSCGYHSNIGNKLATHMVKCGKSTCYYHAEIS